MMKRWLICALVFALLLTPVALAQTNLSAKMEDGRIVAEWSGCATENATLTVYRDNWPILVLCVQGASGSYVVPRGYAGTPGSYSVGLRCGDSCVKASVSGQAPTHAPTADPTAQPVHTPTAEPIATPTATECPTPVATPSAVPTATPAVTASPTPVATPSAVPTATPVVTASPAPTARPTRVPTAAPTATPTPGSSLSGMAQEVVDLVNRERAAQGLGALQADANLSAAACIRAREIVESFSHTRPDGSSWSTVSERARGENIAMGYATSSAVMTGWMNSTGHRENILRASFSTIGVCAYQLGNTIYWVQLFG